MRKMRLFLLIFAILLKNSLEFPLNDSVADKVINHKNPELTDDKSNKTDEIRGGFKTEVIENVVESLLNDTLISEAAGDEVEVIEGNYDANETLTRLSRHSHGGGGHSHSHSHSHSYSGGHHHHFGGYSGIHHHHYYYSPSYSYYGGSGIGYYGGGYYGGYYGNYYNNYGYGYGGYGYGYGYGNGYYGYGNTYYGGYTGLARMCVRWLWGCSITNYRA